MTRPNRFSVTDCRGRLTRNRYHHANEQNLHKLHKRFNYAPRKACSWDDPP